MRKPDFAPTRINTTGHSIGYSAKNKTFTVFDSDLGGLKPSAIYNDSCDYGYTLLSSRTGNKVVFAHTSYEMNEYNELEASIYTSIWPKEHTGYTLRIFND